VDKTGLFFYRKKGKKKYRNMKKITIILFLCFLLAGIVSPKLYAKADDLGTQCATITDSTTGCPTGSAADCKVMLQKCADYYDQQSAQLAQDLTKTSAQKNTLQSAITKLKNKISTLESDINHGKIMVKDLNVQISDTEVSINKTASQIQSSQNQLVAILRSVYEEEQKPAVIVLLEGNLSDFFSNLAYLDSLNSQVGDLLGSNKNLKAYLANQQIKMSNNVDQLQKTVALQTLQKKENEQNQQQQSQYLKLTEAQYQQQLKDKQAAEKKSAAIKTMLFQVAGVSGVSKAPTFGEAIDIAKSVGTMIGIRPAFLLAEISQESAIGRNVGQCMLVDATTGAGKKVSSGAPIIRVMKPTRDVQPFIQITTALGRDPYSTPVSCWIPAYVSGQPSGWGGAMGPAQFIASTWNLFADRLKSLLGHTADPWNIKDSFTASAMYLYDLGASAQTPAKASAAASRYYGGSSSYARQVMSRASCIQTFIDDGTMTASCQKLILGK
jgi:peptidoglycan hydrolase CwlO-like protein